MLEIPELREQLLEAAKNYDVEKVRQLVKKSQQVDFAEVLEEFEQKIILRIFRMLQRDEEAEIFSYLSPNTQEFLINSFDTLELKEIVDDLYSDDLVDVIDEMPTKVVKKVLRSTSAERRAEINNILKYEEKTAGGMMSVNFVEIRETDTVDKVIKKIREIHDDFEVVNVLFVVDKYGYLKGKIDFKDLIFNDPKTKIKDIMDIRILSVPTTADQEEVTAIFKRYDVNALPVIDEAKKMVGLITVDDVIDVIDEEATEDITKLAGINRLDDEYFDISIWKMLKSRSVWLIAMLLIGSIVQILMIVFFIAYGVEGKIDDKWYAGVMLLAPMALLLAGVVGISANQSATVMVRAISLGEIKRKEIFRVVLKELLTSLLIALILIAINFLRLLLIYGVQFSDFNHPNLFKTILVSSITLLISILFGNLLGTLLPLIAKFFKLDPTFASAPLVTTILDIVTISVFFGMGLALF